MGASRHDAPRWVGRATHLALALVCYLPLLLSARGRLAADTRQAVYLDPGRFIVDALSMWDPSRDLGTVTHQNIVLVWPMGVFYRAAELLGMPLWLAQRAWLGTILFLAGAGVLHLARTLRWAPPGAVGPVVAAFAYAMSPYVLQYGTRTSVLLLPWAALPWLIALAARSLTTRGWRHPAVLALVTASIAVNATAVALALLGPALWIVWSVLGSREVPWRPALAAVGRMALLGGVTSLWWVVALLIEGRYGMPLLSYTETIEQVASTSSATEVLRGLGYWVPYLEQHGYHEVSGAALYLRRLPVMALQFAVVVLAFAGAVSVRARHRSFFAGLVVVGVVVGVGAFPTTDGSPLAARFLDLARSGGVGLALRSTTRAAPLALLGVAVLLGMTVDAVVVRRRAVGLALGGAVVVVAIALAPSVGGRQLVDPLFSRPEKLPEHWTEAMAAADEGAGNGRMLEIPGTRFASYRWGTTYEPITAGKAETPSAWREQIPYGGPGAADVLVALDNRIQEGRLDPAALAPVARLLGVTELLVRNDLAYERYSTIAPDRVWALASSEAEGLGPAVGFGPLGVNRPDPRYERDDQPRPADPDATYPPLGLVPVEGSRGLVQLLPLAGTVVLDGDAEGIVDAAAAGLVDGRAALLQAATAADDPALLDRVLDEGAPIVLTDTNRRRVRRWRHIENTNGVTLRADQDPSVDDGKDGGEAALEVFPGTGSAWQTVAAPTGARLSATRYGNPLWFERGLRPAAAMDGSRDTGWQVGPDIGGVGDRLTIELDRPVRTDRLALSGSRGTTHLTAVAVRLDEGEPVRFELGAASRDPGGQELRFAEQTISRISIELAASAPAAPGAPAGSFGIDEVELRDGGRPVVVDEALRLPTALVERLGRGSVANPLAVVLTRLRGDVDDPRIFSEESRIARELVLPTARTFAVTGQVRPAVDLEGDAVRSVPPPGPCRSDLVQIDGEPVAVRVTGPAADAQGDAVTITGCEPITLAAGEHRLVTTPVDDLDVDQLVLGSTAGGGPAAVAPDGRLRAAAAPVGADVSWDRTSLSGIDVEVEGGDGPAWLLLAESHNAGWEASGLGASDRAPVLLNGFANGWLVDDIRPGMRLELSWRPQRTMTLALVLSALGAIVALALAVRGRRWTDLDVAGPGPDLALPWAPGESVGAARSVSATLLVGAAAGVVIGPWWGVAVGALVLAAGRLRRGRVLLAGGSVAAISLAFGAVLADRYGKQEEHVFTFFTSLHGQHRIAMLGVSLLAADLILERVRRRTPLTEG